jgi:hypothetical protein
VTRVYEDGNWKLKDYNSMLHKAGLW